MKTDRDYYTIDAMLKYGGSFVKSLASLAQHADYDNFNKIKNTWPEYWDQYEKMGIELEKTS